MAADDATGGYWLVASDGGVFAFNAPFLGSTGNIALAKPVVGMQALANGRGYRFVASDGGIFSYGAPFYGSTGAIQVGEPVVGMSRVLIGHFFSAVSVVLGRQRERGPSGGRARRPSSGSGRSGR
jgi:hypothetical protein